MGEIPRHLEQSERHDFGRKALIFCSIAAAALGTLFLLWYLLDLWLLMFAAILVSVLVHAPSQWLSDHTPLSHAWSLAAVVLAIAALLAGSAVGSSRRASPSKRCSYRRSSQRRSTSCERGSCKVIGARRW